MQKLTSKHPVLFSVFNLPTVNVQQIEEYWDEVILCFLFNLYEKSVGKDFLLTGLLKKKGIVMYISHASFTEEKLFKHLENVN